MPRTAFLLLLIGSLALLPRAAQAQDQGYFSTSEKQLTFMEEGSRSQNERILVASFFGAGVLIGAVGTYYALDSRDLSDEVSASGIHTGKIWSQEFEDTRSDAMRSRGIAQVSLGIAGGLVLAGIVSYILTDPGMEPGYQDWQATNFAAPTKGGFVLGRSYRFQ